MSNFIQEKTKKLNFNEAIKFMDMRAAYYEEELHEPADFEVHVEIEDEKIWIRQLAPDCFDVLVESEQTSLGLEVTNVFDYAELIEFIDSINAKEFICGPIFNRENLR